MRFRRPLNHSIARRSALGLLCAVISIALATPRVAVAQDSASVKPLFTWQDGLLAWGFAGLTLGARPLDKHYATRLQSPRTQENRWLQKSAIGFRTIAEPGSVIIG